jgi:predicted acyl esterase
MPNVLASARLVLLVACSLLAGAALAEAAESAPGDAPPAFQPKTGEFDFVKREVMIPMRDGVKLKTFVLVPKGAKGAPMILDRTPYNASNRIARFESPHLASVVPQMLDTAVAAGYIVVYQDVRGKYGSEGDYVMTRPLRGPFNPTATDHATDTYDTIDWLVKNVPESNGRVGTIGGSYEGFTALMSVIDPHPALKASVPFAPMVDGWMGDDWFHNGAFRQDGALEYTYEQEATRKNEAKWWSGTYDTYEFWLRAGNAGNVAKARGLDALEYWRALSEHTNYDDFWQSQAMDKVLAARPMTVPMMIVGGLFDQEDIYGAPALFRALGPKDPDGKMIHLVLGPWNHGGGRRDGRSIGEVQFEGQTATWFRRNVMQPFLDLPPQGRAETRHARVCSRMRPARIPGSATTTGRAPATPVAARSRETSTCCPVANSGSIARRKQSRLLTNTWLTRQSPYRIASARRSIRAPSSQPGANG